MLVDLPDLPPASERTVSDRTIAFFARHFVRLGWTDTTPGERSAMNEGLGQIGNASCFIISVRDQWFLITAGHVIKDVETAISNGQALGSWYLDDTSSLGAVSNISIPFDYPNSYKFWFYDDLGADYALIHIRQYYRRLLEANHVVAINEQ